MSVQDIGDPDSPWIRFFFLCELPCFLGKEGGVVSHRLLHGLELSFLSLRLVATQK